MGGFTVPHSGEILAHPHHSFSKTGTVRTQRKKGILAYLGGARTLRVDTVMMLLYVTHAYRHYACICHKETGKKRK
jgi:hypothetical protein